LTKLLYKTGKASSWQLSSNAVAEYENAVQRFLQCMVVLVHVASGQPARRPELLGLRWCNKQVDRRNLLVFILTYYKSLNLTNSSRYAVRFLFFEFGSLLVRHLIPVQPFRTWLREETDLPANTTDYLWHDGDGVWSEN